MNNSQETESDESQSRYEISSPEEFPSIGVVHGEIHKQYSTEQTRKGQIESKISAVIAINALIVSLIGSLGQLRTTTTVLVLLPAVVSAGIGLYALSGRNYCKPGPVPDELFAYARQDKTNARKNFIQNYRQAINHNSSQNDCLASALRWSVCLTGMSFIFIFSSPVVDIILAYIANGIEVSSMSNISSNITQFVGSL